MYTYIHTYYIYIYIERERGRADAGAPPQRLHPPLCWPRPRWFGHLLCYDILYYSIIGYTISLRAAASDGFSSKVVFISGSSQDGIYAQSTY